MSIARVSLEEDRAGTPTIGEWDVIRTMFECPATGQPLRSTMMVGGWPAREDESVSAHCPKCGELHRFHAEDAILLMDGGEMVPLRLVAPA